MRINNMNRHLLLALLWFLGTGVCLRGGERERWQEVQTHRAAYRQALAQVRRAHGGSYHLPAVDFFLFGMGPRTKYVYQKGRLSEAFTGKLLRQWSVAEEIISPTDYSVALKTQDGKYVFLSEDEAGVWLIEDGRKQALTQGSVVLPDFLGHKHRLVLRVLHQELLINIVSGRPVPNFFVYPKPWYRDAAMVAMVLSRTGNLPLIKNWILNLREPYDRNNGGEQEPDNLGQVLYLLSLVADKSHPLVPVVQKELVRFQKGTWLVGRTDFAPHPVYQTKWAKFGLRALGLQDPYTIPKENDSYGALFWWAYREEDAAQRPVWTDDRYPYLAWAASHYTGRRLGKLSDRDYPLTWESQASQAKYEGLKYLSEEYVRSRTCAPHAWHAAEAFLLLWEEKE
jgi:hypothetical protein